MMNEENENGGKSALLIPTYYEDRETKEVYKMKSAEIKE